MIRLMSDDPREDAQDREAGPDKRDAFAPPPVPVECFCMHCHRTFMSDQMWLQKAVNGGDGFEGFWMCPTPNCSGAGFTFDIFPTDPAHPANDGWFGDEETHEDRATRDWNWDEDEFSEELSFDDEEGDSDWDPEETQYKMLDEMSADDDDMEGEEWKHGIEPEFKASDDREAPIPGTEDDESARYDQPDQRPREVDMSDRPGGMIGEDDIPF